MTPTSDRCPLCDHNPACGRDGFITTAKGDGWETVRYCHTSSHSCFNDTVAAIPDEHGSRFQRVAYYDTLDIEYR